MRRVATMILNLLFIMVQLNFHFIDRSGHGHAHFGSLCVRDEIVLVFRIQKNFDLLLVPTQIDGHFDLTHPFEIMEQFLHFFADFLLRDSVEMPVTGGNLNLHERILLGA